MKAHHESSRRKFIKTSLQGTALITLGIAGTAELLSCRAAKKTNSALHFTTGFKQALLPYTYDALEDVIDAKTMEIHYTKHAAAYTKNLNDAAAEEKVNTSEPLEKILGKISKYSDKMRNNAGGHYNHQMFWYCMQPKEENNIPTGKIADEINKAFGSFQAFKKTFSAAALSRFGSGWAWLVIDNNRELKIGSTPNQDNPLMDVATLKGFPLLCLDVWEHAYYLKYQNKRADYIENWFKLINWRYVNLRLEQ